MRGDENLQLTRRAAVAAIGASAAALLTPRIAAAASRRVHGLVIDDCAGARKRGLPGVMVSNGEDVAVTDADGRWSLSTSRGDPVFVIEPAQWSVGERAFAVRDAFASTGPLDFALRRAPQRVDFEALLFADTQAANAAELSYVRDDLLRSAAASSAAFALHHGDVMGDDLSLFAPYKRILDETRLRWRHCPGNHDLDLDAVNPGSGFETWKREIGPTHSAFAHAGALFILLNNVDYLGERTLADGRRYRGRFGARQLRFVENVLRNTPEDTLICISMHIPLTSYDAPHSISDTTSDAGDLLRLLSRFAHTISFSGHSHTTEHHDFGPEQGFARATPHRHQVLTAASGSWWSGPADARGAPVAVSRDGSPRGYHALEVDRNHASTRFVALSAETPAQLRVMARHRANPRRPIEEPIPREALADVELLVNVFDGRPATRATFTCGGHTCDLIRTDTADPHAIEIFETYRALCKPWVAAARSSHIWTAPLSSALSTGVHTISVEVELNGARSVHGRLSIEIA